MAPAALFGRFTGVAGLSFRSGTLEGTTGPDGEYQYAPGEIIAFSIGALELGSAAGRQNLSVLNLFDNLSLHNPKILNRARLLFCFAPGLGFEKPIKINDHIRDVVSKYANEIDLDSDNPAEMDPIFQKICAELNFPMKSIHHIRNHLRRLLAGFKVLRDIRIPVRDGNYVLTDIYLPLCEGLYPVLASNTIYGKRVVYSGPDVDDADDVSAFEKAEDDWHSTKVESPLHVPNTGPWFGGWTKQRVYETIGTFDTFFWVPRGYAMAKIDPRGVSQTPGTRGIPGQEASDIFDAVEWIASQPWCNGNVALAGNSYGANCQWQVASQKPRGLKAIIPYATDIDFYRDVAYIGGVTAWNFLAKWSAGIRAASSRWKDAGDVVQLFASHPFYDTFWENLAQQLEKVDLPCFLAAAQMLICHHRGPYEAWRRIASETKHLQIVDTNYYGWPNHEAAEKLLLFADRHLKGIDHLNLEPVGMQMRIGAGNWYWRTEEDWVVPGTVYVDWYFHLDGSLSKELPLDEVKVVFPYSAEIEPKGEKAGVSFISAPFENDVELAGHFTASLNISSTTYDADVVVSLWALDEEGNIVKFCVGSNTEPFASGLLRASHRKTDPEKSVPWRPWHTHKENDHSPLSRDEVVEVNVEICPATARIQCGWRLRVDVLPSEAQPNVAGYSATALRSWEREYHDGAVYSLHVGGDLVNFICVPTVPLKEIGLLNSIPARQGSKS